MGDMKERNTHRERERGTKRYISIIKNATVTIMNNQPLQKVTKSLYIVTHLGQLPFILFTQMARTWALKEDSVNTSIIHWYSTGREGASGRKRRRWVENCEKVNYHKKYLLTRLKRGQGGVYSFARDNNPIDFISVVCTYDDHCLLLWHARRISMHERILH